MYCLVDCLMYLVNTELQPAKIRTDPSSSTFELDKSLESDKQFKHGRLFICVSKILLSLHKLIFLSQIESSSQRVQQCLLLYIGILISQGLFNISTTKYKPYLQLLCLNIVHRSLNLCSRNILITVQNNINRVSLERVRLPSQNNN